MNTGIETKYKVEAKKLIKVAIENFVGTKRLFTDAVIILMAKAGVTELKAKTCLDVLIDLNYAKKEGCLITFK